MKGSTLGQQVVAPDSASMVIIFSTLLSILLFIGSLFLPLFFLLLITSLYFVLIRRKETVLFGTLRPESLLKYLMAVFALFVVLVIMLSSGRATGDMPEEIDWQLLLWLYSQLMFASFLATLPLVALWAGWKRIKSRLMASS